MKRRHSRSPCLARFPLIHHASADGRGEMNTIIYGLRPADTRGAEKGSDCTLRYTSVKLNPEQLPWLPVQRRRLPSGTPAARGAGLGPADLPLPARSRGSLKASKEKSLTHNFI